MTRIRVEVVYALPLVQDCSVVEVEQGASLEQAVRVCGVLERNREIDLQHAQVGIWGRRAGLSAVLREGDRVEIYRPLAADPKQVRRERAVRKPGSK